LLCRGSFAYEQPSFYANRKSMEEMGKRNKKRRRYQRAGLGVLMISFILAGVSVVL
jgi:hypothetical protein